MSLSPINALSKNTLSEFDSLSYGGPIAPPPSFQIKSPDGSLFYSPDGSPVYNPIGT